MWTHLFLALLLGPTLQLLAYTLPQEFPLHVNQCAVNHMSSQPPTIITHIFRWN